MMMRGEFKRNANYQSSSGELFFGGIGGIVYFHPFKDETSHPILDLYFSDLYVYNKRIEANDSNREFLNKNIEISDHLTFPHSIKSFSIGFGAIEFNEPDKVIYQTKMEGFEEEWKTITAKNRLVTFTNLPSGDYVFKVRAFLPGSVSLERNLPIMINPSSWLTWWAKLIYAVLFLFLAYYIFVAIRNKSEQRKETLRKASETQIMQSKLQFFTDISHEIRTPLTLILTPVEQLLKEEKDPSLINIYRLIIKNGQRILRLINQTIEMRKIDRGQISLNPEDTNVANFVEEVAHSFDYIAKENNIKFVLNIEDNMPYLHLDRDILDKVLVNVISNAFKYTEQGGQVTIDVNADNLQLEIRISDTGIGIPLEQRESVFHRFYRVSNENNKTAMGSGIGLHISRRLIEIQHGEIFIEDTITGTGTSFVIIIPTTGIIQKPLETEKKLLINDSKKKLINDSTLLVTSEEDSLRSNNIKRQHKLLIVEDDKDIRHYLSAILSNEYTIIEAENGLEGLEKAMKYMPDCIISDLIMPKMDGLEFCRKIKINEKTSHMPLIILTAKAAIADRIEALQVGADSYIPKPFSVDHLKTRISKLIELRAVMSGKYRVNDDIDKREMKSADDLFLDKLESIIKSKISDSELSVDAISKEIGISRSHFQRKMKKLTKQNPSEYIKIMRLRYAAHLLDTKQLTISEITYATGFTTLSHFSNSFKEYYGVSPSKYMEIVPANNEIQHL